MFRFPFTFSPLELLKDVHELKCLNPREGQSIKSSLSVLLFQRFDGALRKDSVISPAGGGGGKRETTRNGKVFFFKGVVLIKSSSMRPTERQTVR